MKKKPSLVFAHDARFFKCNDEKFTINLSAKIWNDRYLSSFKQLCVVARDGGEILDDYSRKFVRASDENVTFSLIPYDNLLIASIIHRDEFLSHIREALKKCDCVIVRLPSTVGLYVIGECRRQNIPYLVECVGCTWDTMVNHSVKGKILAPIYYFLTKKAIYTASHVIYITERFLQQRYPTQGQSAVCSNVILPDLDSDKIKEKLKKNTRRDKYIIGSCGSVSVKFKGHQFVIESISILRKKGYNVYYEVVGGGNQSFLRKVAKKNNVEEYVSFLGSKSSADTKSWMDNIDIYIQPSLSEGQGRSLIEAMRSGCACLCSAVGGMTELIEEKYTFKKGNPKAIADCFVNMITDLDECMKLHMKDL